MSLPERGALLGLREIPSGCEAIEILPGPHLADAGAMLPVIRAQMALGMRLAGLHGISAVSWLPARSWMEPGYFRKVMADWLQGGAFPALGLTTLDLREGGGAVTVGLGFLIGQELELNLGESMGQPQIARLAIRLVHELVTEGPIREARELVGPGEERLLARPFRGGAAVEVGWAV